MTKKLLVLFTLCVTSIFANTYDRRHENFAYQKGIRKLTCYGVYNPCCSIYKRSYIYELPEHDDDHLWVSQRDDPFVDALTQ